MNSSLSWFVCGIFHIMSIPFNYTNAPIRVVKAIMIGANVVTLCFSLFALFLEFRESAYCQETGRVFGQLLHWLVPVRRFPSLSLSILKRFGSAK